MAPAQRNDLSAPAEPNPGEALAALEAPSVAIQSATNLRYMPGLDVVRGLAILLVLLYHGLSQQPVFVEATRQPLTLVHEILELGHVGVHLFFILSGFLITGILLEARTAPDYYGRFYSRRALRILPAYALMLAILKVSHAISVRFMLAALFFVANMPRLFGASTEYGPLWSLSVEEQFYIVWPLCVRGLSRRNLGILAIALIALTPVLRFALTFASPGLNDANFKTWDVGDFFAAGALLSLMIRSQFWKPYLHRVCWVLLALGVVTFGIFRSLPVLRSPIVGQAVFALGHTPWLLGWSGVTLLGYLRPGLAKRTSMRPLLFLANISYGLYLCHEFVFERMQRFLPIGVHSASETVTLVFARFLVEASVATVLAWISRNTVEAYFLKLKRNVPLHRSAQATVHS